MYVFFSVWNFLTPFLQNYVNTAGQLILNFRLTLVSILFRSLTSTKNTDYGQVQYETRFRIFACSKIWAWSTAHAFGTDQKSGYHIPHTMIVTIICRCRQSGVLHREYRKDRQTSDRKYQGGKFITFRDLSGSVMWQPVVKWIFALCFQREGRFRVFFPGIFSANLTLVWKLSFLFF